MRKAIGISFMCTNQVFIELTEILEGMGIDVQSIDPRHIRIFGHGGKMLKMQNEEDFLIDPVENAIKIIGEEDGSFDSSDYIFLCNWSKRI